MSLDSNTSNTTDLKKKLLHSTEVDLISVEEDVVQISEFVTDDPTLLGGDDVAELLQRLTSASNMAEGMESKLDNVLQNLDNLLALLDDIGDGKQSADDGDDPIVKTTNSEDGGDKRSDSAS
ncbi:hypothetical protein BJ912DRAFT_1052565 [Pholiota molesta]|nr:hypothetical protein BJ912DRAFT_1052565 [Pholiota molesta]